MSPRLVPVSEAEAAKRWRELVLRARIEARQGEGRDTVLLHQAAIKVSRAPFPIEGEGAKLAAGALRDLALAYAMAIKPNRITAIAPALEGAAKCVDELLDEPAHDAAAETARRLGERQEV